MKQTSKMLLQLVALLVVAGALGLYAYFGVVKVDEHATKKKEHDTRLFAPEKLGEKAPDGSTPEVEFVSLVVKNGAETTTLERPRGGQWKLVSPIQQPGDRIILDSLVSQLQTAKFKSTLDENPTDADLKKYGLSPEPVFSVEATAEVGPEKERRTVKLEGGIENPFDGSIYMRRNGEKPVYLAEGGVRWVLGKSTFDLRDKEVLAFDESKLVAFQVKSKANDWRMIRNADNAWAFTKPYDGLADATSISGMLSSIRADRALAFLTDSPEARRAYGFDEPLVDALLTFADNKTIRVRLAQPPGDAGNKLYALRENDGSIVLVEVVQSVLSHFDRNAYELRDKTILNVKRDLIAKLVFHNADGSELVVEKQAVDAAVEQWRLTAPVNAPAKTYKMITTLYSLVSLKGSLIVVENPKEKDLETYGLGAKAQRITMFDSSGTQLARFVIGKNAPEKPNAVYVLGTKPMIIEVDGSRFNEIPSQLADLLDEPAATTDAGKSSSAP